MTDVDGDDVIPAQDLALWLSQPAERAVEDDPKLRSVVEMLQQASRTVVTKFGW